MNLTLTLIYQLYEVEKKIFKDLIQFTYGHICLNFGPGPLTQGALISQFWEMASCILFFPFMC